MRKTVDILDIAVDSITMKQALDNVIRFLSEDRVHTIFTPNAEIMMAAQRDPDLKKILLSADMVIADGAGVVLASKVLKRSVPEKVSGIDLVKNCFNVFSQNTTNTSGKKASFFLFGSKPGVAEAAAENILKDYPGVRISGTRNGYFTTEDEQQIIQSINSSDTDILLVALGAPKQEKWIRDHVDMLKVKVCIGVGGALDVISGKTKPTPEFMRRNGLEWLHRLYKEPKRAKRMLDLPRFMMRVIFERLKNK